MIGKPVKAAQKQAMGNFRGNTFITDPKAFRAAAEADTQKKLASLTAEQKKRISDTKASKARSEEMRMEAFKKAATAVKAGTSNASNANASKPTSMKDMLDQHNARAKSIQTSKDPVAARNAAEKEKQARMEAAYTKQLSSAKYSAPTADVLEAFKLLSQKNAKTALKPGTAQKPIGKTSATPVMDIGDAVRRVTSSIGKSPLDGFKNLPKLYGPLGRVGTSTMNKPVAAKAAGIGNAYQLSTQKQMQDAAMKQKPNQQPNQKSPLAGKNIGDIRKISGGLGAFGKKPGMKAGGSVSSASSRGDGCATKGKTKGRMV